MLELTLGSDYDEIENVDSLHQQLREDVAVVAHLDLSAVRFEPRSQYRAVLCLNRDRHAITHQIFTARRARPAPSIHAIPIAP